MLTRSTGVLVALAILGLASPVAAERADSFAQASLQFLRCDPNGGVPPWVDIGFSTTLDAKATAVLISVSVLAEFTPNSWLFLRPTVDGVGFNTDPQVAHMSGTILDGQRTTLSFSRAYAVNSGAHTYGLEWGCGGDSSIVDGWMTVVPIR